MILNQASYEISQFCGSHKDFQIYREAVRPYDERCFYFIDKVIDCANLFIESLKTNVRKEFIACVKTCSDLINPIDRSFLKSRDQLSDIHAICNGTIQNCFQNVKPLEPCEGYALEKVMSCSLNDYVHQPFKYFRCNEKWEVSIKARGARSRKTMLQNVTFTFVFSVLIFLSWIYCYCAYFVYSSSVVSFLFLLGVNKNKLLQGVMPQSRHGGSCGVAYPFLHAPFLLTPDQNNTQPQADVRRRGAISVASVLLVWLLRQSPGFFKRGSAESFFSSITRGPLMEHK